MTTSTRNMASRPAIMLFLGALLGGGGQGEIFAQDDNRGYKVQVGDPVPDFSLTDLDGKTWSKESLMGSVYVLQFTASWCSVCRKEMPHLEKRVWQVFQRRGSRCCWGSTWTNPPKKFKASWKPPESPTQFALDPGGALFSAVTLPKAGVTRNVVVDQEGRIAFLTRLFNEEEFESMIAAIETLNTPKMSKDFNRRKERRQKRCTPQKNGPSGTVVCRGHGQSESADCLQMGTSYTITPSAFSN